MSDFITALGLVFVIEGLVYAFVPGHLKAMMALMQATSDDTLRFGGLIAAAFGVGVGWLARTMVGSLNRDRALLAGDAHWTLLNPRKLTEIWDYEWNGETGSGRGGRRPAGIRGFRRFRAAGACASAANSTASLDR